MLGPAQPLPLPAGFSSTDDYVDSLIEFVTNSETLQTLCGGVHILDFFTRTPDLYNSILPQDWRTWFDLHDINDIIDFLNHEDASRLLHPEGARVLKEQELWRGKPAPPQSLVRYVYDVQRHCLDTSFTPAEDLPVYERKAKIEKTYTPSLRALTAGMNPKKLHEVSNFAHFVSGLADKIGNDTDSEQAKITHIVDFGSGQNYLGRILASRPYCKDIIAVESRAHVVQGAVRMDTRLNLVDQQMVMRNKKQYRSQIIASEGNHEKSSTNGAIQLKEVVTPPQVTEPKPDPVLIREADKTIGQVQYIEHRIQDGDLSNVIKQIPKKTDPQSGKVIDPSLMVISLHSCGNLLHHGLRALTLNPAVRAVAMIGCCYNLMTERAAPPTFKIPALRNTHPRLFEPAAHDDPHGFPMSSRFLHHQNSSSHSHANNVGRSDDNNSSDNLQPTPDQHHHQRRTGISLNITARMMAVQAPRTWTPTTSQAFFTRHFYRALLQRILMDTGVVAAPHDSTHNAPGGRSPAGTGSTALDGTAPVIIGNLSKACYSGFVAYVRGALDKLDKIASSSAPPSSVPAVPASSAASMATASTTAPETQAQIHAHSTAHQARTRVGSLSDAQLLAYEQEYSSSGSVGVGGGGKEGAGGGRKNLSVVWSLMAFSAQTIEAMIVVDRWLWLREQACVVADEENEAWVQTAFDYDKSPRNMVVVGVKKKSTSTRTSTSTRVEV